MIGDAYDHVVVMFSDIVGFSTMSSTMSAVEVFLMLTNLYYAFDRLVDKFGVYKVETIGDGYMIAAGLPTPDTAAFVPCCTRILLVQPLPDAPLPDGPLPGACLPDTSHAHQANCSFCVGLFSQQLPLGSTLGYYCSKSYRALSLTCALCGQYPCSCLLGALCMHDSCGGC